MRTSLTVVIVFLSARWLFGQAPLTVKEIDLMLRSGCSSETVLADLSKRHFAGPLSPETEKQLRLSNASPALLDTLKNQANAASKEETAQGRQRIVQERLSAQQFTKRLAAERAAEAPHATSANREIVIAPMPTATNSMPLLPSEKAAAAAYPNLTMAELNSLLPSERARANATRGAAIAAAKAAAEEEWCAAHPVECAEKEAARERAKAQAQAEAAARGDAEDRQQARRLVDQMRTSLMMGHSRDQLKTDLFMANGQAGPKTRQVIDQMQTDVFMGHSKEQLKTDLFMLNP